MNLHGKIALITGAAKRIGRETALTLAAEGAWIVIHYHDSRKDAETLREAVEALGSKAFLIRADFSPAGGSVAAAVKKFTQELFRKVPHVDILVNNASIYYPVRLGKISEKIWDDFLETNLKAPFFLAQEIGMRMLKRKTGKIINLVDGNYERPPVDFLPYMIAKAGLASATKGLAKALAPHVTVAGISPGPILPPSWRKSTQKAAIARKTLLKRLGGAEEIAKTVKFLVQDSNYITGAIVNVTGGSELY